MLKSVIKESHKEKHLSFEISEHRISVEESDSEGIELVGYIQDLKNKVKPQLESENLFSDRECNLETVDDHF